MCKCAIFISNRFQIKITARAREREGNLKHSLSIISPFTRLLLVRAKRPQVLSQPPSAMRKSWWCLRRGRESSQRGRFTQLEKKGARAAGLFLLLMIKRKRQQQQNES